MSTKHQVAPIVHIAHILLTGPFLIYIGFKRPRSDRPYFLVYALGVAVIVAFVYLLGRDAVSGKLTEDRVALAAKLFHLAIVGPLLLYVGITVIHFQAQRDLRMSVHYALITLGATAIVYHTVVLMLRVLNDFKGSDASNRHPQPGMNPSPASVNASVDANVDDKTGPMPLEAAWAGALTDGDVQQLAQSAVPERTPST